MKKFGEGGAVAAKRNSAAPAAAAVHARPCGSPADARAGPSATAAAIRLAATAAGAHQAESPKIPVAAHPRARNQSAPFLSCQCTSAGKWGHAAESTAWVPAANVAAAAKPHRESGDRSAYGRAKPTGNSSASRYRFPMDQPPCQFGYAVMATKKISVAARQKIQS